MFTQSMFQNDNFIRHALCSERKSIQAAESEKQYFSVDTCSYPSSSNLTNNNFQANKPTITSNCRM